MTGNSGDSSSALVNAGSAMCRPFGRNQSPPLSDEQAQTDAAIYFLLAPNLNRVKIGYATKLKQRIGNLQVGCPDKLKLVLALQGKCYWETALHAMFADLRVTGEWFKYEGALREFVENGGVGFSPIYAPRPEFDVKLRVRVRPDLPDFTISSRIVFYCMWPNSAGPTVRKILRKAGLDRRMRDPITSEFLAFLRAKFPNEYRKSLCYIANEEWDQVKRGRRKP